MREQLDFAFEKCWTCLHCIFDMRTKHMCRKTGQAIRNPHTMTCDGWEKGDFYMH